MMKSRKVFLSVLYLLLYSSFSTSQISPVIETQVGKGIDTTVNLIKCLNDVATWASKPEGAKTIQKVLDIFEKIAKFASGLSFVGALVGFIFAFIPKANPTLEFMKVQFSEVNRKLDSIALQLKSLAEKMEWTAYASVYSIDENNIKTSWIKLKEFIDSAAEAKTEQMKTRFAERFTTFYENAGTEKSVYNFYNYLTESNPVSLNKNLLALVTEKSKGDIKTLAQFAAYFTSLMVTGLQLNLYYFALKGYDGKIKAKEAVTQLTNVRSKIQASFIECADNFEMWAKEDVEKIGTEPLPDNIHLAFSIKEHLDKKFNWYEWTVIVRDKKDGEEKTYGNSITVIAQNKVVIDVLHREKGFSVNQAITAQMEQEWDSKGKLCREKIAQWPIIFSRTPLKHVEYMHGFVDFKQTTDDKVKQLKCPNQVLPTEKGNVYLDYKTFTVYLKSQELVEKDPCFGVKCNQGQCRQIKDTSSRICKCKEMFYGPTCEVSVQDDIDYAIMEIKIVGISYQPVPDMTTIYYDLKEMKKYQEDAVNTLRQDIQWTQIFVKYIDVIEKFRYLAKVRDFLNKETISQDRFDSEVQALFTEGNTFLYMLHKFDLMMQGKGFGDKSNILDILRQSLLTKPLNKDDRSKSNSIEACSEIYTEKIEYFVRLMFAMEKEAVLGWQKYWMDIGNTEAPKGTAFRASSTNSSRAELQNINDVDIVAIFKQYVSQQWSLYNRNGCGSLKAVLLSNAYCEKPYHSTDLQQVPLSCQYVSSSPQGLPKYLPFPSAVQCSKGKWSALPVCYSHPKRGTSTCMTKDGATVCTASCSSSWTFPDGTSSETKKCTQQPCPSFTPRDCDRCATSNACGSREVCHSGKCVDGCSVFRCGVNAQCSTTNHVQSCSCVGSWIPWKNEQPQREGCRYQQLQWVDLSSFAPVPKNAVTSKTGYHVCRTKGPDGGWHGGWIWNNAANSCNYDYDWKEHRGYSFQVLVDPCGGSGVHWLSGGIYVDTVEIGQAIQWPWITYLVCSRQNNGLPGKLFNTRSGLKCHYGYENKGDRDDNFYSLVKKRCV